MHLQTNRYKDTLRTPNLTYLKVYGYGDSKKIKLTLLTSARTSGIENVDLEPSEDKEKNKFSNDHKLEQSIIRSKEKIFELAYCNPWDYFFTGTLNSKKYDRTDIEKFHKDLTRFIRDYSTKHDLNIKFLLIPELHSDGKSWHVHGFIFGLPEKHLTQFKIGDKMSKFLADKVRNGDVIYNWKAYENKFGFCDLEPIKSHEGVSKYVTKYINKNLFNSIQELNAHLYYHSRGLKFAETIKKGFMDWSSIKPDFKNFYCGVKTFDYSPEMLETLVARFYN